MLVVARLAVGGAATQPKPAAGVVVLRQGRRGLQMQVVCLRAGTHGAKPDEATMQGGGDANAATGGRARKVIATASTGAAVLRRGVGRRPQQRRRRWHASGRGDGRRGFILRLVRRCRQARCCCCCNISSSSFAAAAAVAVQGPG